MESVVGTSALALILVVLVTPFGRGALVSTLVAWLGFVFGLTRLVRGVGRVRLLLPVVSGSPLTGETRDCDATAPFSGRACCYCEWTLERDASGEATDSEQFAAIATGSVGGRFRVDERRVDVTGRTLLGVGASTVPEGEWPDDPRRLLGADTDLPRGDDTTTRGVERLLADGTTVTVLPDAVFAGRPSAGRSALVRSLFLRVGAGGLLASGAVVTVFGSPP